MSWLQFQFAIWFYVMTESSSHGVQAHRKGGGGGGGKRDLKICLSGHSVCESVEKFKVPNWKRLRVNLFFFESHTLHWNWSEETALFLCWLVVGACAWMEGFQFDWNNNNNKKNKIRKTLITTDFYLKRFLFKRLILKITVWNNSCLESLVSLGTVDFGQNPLWLLSVFFLFLRCAWLAAPETWWCVLTSSALSTTSKSSVGTCTVTMVTCSATLDKSTTMSSEFQKKLKICIVSDLVLFKKINK